MGWDGGRKSYCLLCPFSHLSVCEENWKTEATTGFTVYLFILFYYSTVLLRDDFDSIEPLNPFRNRRILFRSSVTNSLLNLYTFFSLLSVLGMMILECYVCTPHFSNFAQVTFFFRCITKESLFKSFPFIFYLPAQNISVFLSSKP